jgi:hypothetical protein
MDICFIKPQDLLALSIAIWAWHFDKVKWLSRSAIHEEYSDDTDQRDPKGIWPNLSRRSNEQQDSGRELNLK